jgi:serine/threonine-protein kinase
MAREVTDRSVVNTTHFAPGTVLGRRYRIDDLIAEGGMGIVYRGWHILLEQVIAIKVMRSEHAHHPRAVARFLSEARAMAQLRGIHAVRVLDIASIQGGPPYMVLEYLDGRDLRSLLDEDGPLPVAQAIDYLLQTCEGLAEAHALGMVHRDLKPENLFLIRLPDDTEVIKIIDFGISKRADGDRCQTLGGQSLGSPGYMSPQQMASPDRVDARADIWSLGVLLFELLTGIMPFGSGSIPQVCYRVLCQEPDSLRSLRKDLPRELENVLGRCLSKLADERYANVQELAEALTPFASEPGAESARRVGRIFGTFARQPDQPLSLDVQWVENPDEQPDILPDAVTRECVASRPPPSSSLRAVRAA